MDKGKPTQRELRILASVKEEMQKPRLTESVRRELVDSGQSAQYGETFCLMPLASKGVDAGMRLEDELVGHDVWRMRQERAANLLPSSKRPGAEAFIRDTSERIYASEHAG